MHLASQGVATQRCLSESLLSTSSCCHQCCGCSCGCGCGGCGHACASSAHKMSRSDNVPVARFGTPWKLWTVMVFTVFQWVPDWDTVPAPAPPIPSDTTGSGKPVLCPKALFTELQTTQSLSAPLSCCAYNSVYTRYYLKRIAQQDSPDEIHRFCLWDHPNPCSTSGDTPMSIQIFSKSQVLSYSKDLDQLSRYLQIAVRTYQVPVVGNLNLDVIVGSGKLEDSGTIRTKYLYPVQYIPGINLYGTLTLHASHTSPNSLSQHRILFHHPSNSATRTAMC